MNYEESTTTSAGLDRAWAALANVTSYPKWTKSMTSVEPLDAPVLAVGNRFRIQQPGLPPGVWRVSDVREGESFEWEAKSPGVHTVGYHRLRANPDGTTTITLGIRQSGTLAWLVGLFIAGKTRRYVQMEAAGTKAAAEVQATAGDGTTSTDGR
ncbi:SRPBCC family protein [Micromonospora maritima]|uniref:SRPBCC family protein n=1 Tax=Micromonospora maritima TaxID=986711 RepID=UPI0037B4E221